MDVGFVWRLFSCDAGRGQKRGGVEGHASLFVFLMDILKVCFHSLDDSDVHVTSQ